MSDEIKQSDLASIRTARNRIRANGSVAQKHEAQESRAIRSDQIRSVQRVMNMLLYMNELLSCCM